MDLINYCYAKSSNPSKNKLQSLLKKCDINKEVDGKTALSYLVKTDNVDIVEWMILKGADPSRGHLLVEACNIACVLDQYDIDAFHDRLDELDGDDYTPEEYKKGYQNKKMYEFLLNIGLDVNETHEDMNPLEAVCLEGDLDKIALILKKDVNKDNITYFCKVKVYEAIESERAKWLAVLISPKKVSNEYKENEPLHHLSDMHNKTLAQMLLPFL